jgi:hypothetical protein
LFPIDKKPHCIEWYDNYIIVILTIFGIAVLIAIGNIGVEVLVIFGA